MKLRRRVHYGLKQTAFTALAFFIVTIGFGQVKLQPVQPVKERGTSGKQWEIKAESVPDSLVSKTIRHCDEMIAAIDTKVNIVSADPAQKAEAEKTDWYAQMARNRTYFVTLRDELLKRGAGK